MAVLLASLEELPEFFTDNPFTGTHELPVHAIARLTHRQNHDVDPPYRLNEVVYVIGRSVNIAPRGGDKEYFLFCAAQAMNRLDGTTIAVNASGLTRRSSDLEVYEVFRSKAELHRLYP
jgi:hypothetical protein